MRLLSSCLALLLVISSCKEDAVSRLSGENSIAEYQNALLHWGDTLELDGMQGDSVIYKLNDREIQNPILSATNSVLGMNRLSQLSYKDGKPSKREVIFTIVTTKAPEAISFEIIKKYPHDESSFTEGLFYEDGVVFEGTGLNGQSKLLSYKLATGEILQTKSLDAEYFGEGIARVGDSLFQLTYKAGKVFVYNAETFEKIGELKLNFSAEGWGLCYDGSSLIMSNGSHFLYYIDPRNFSLQKTIQVTDNKGVVSKLNELEYHHGRIYANVWYEKEVVVINAETGGVEEVISLLNLPAKSFSQGVANGIAIKDGNLLITGKNWSDTYELRASGTKRD